MLCKEPLPYVAGRPLKPQRAVPVALELVLWKLDMVAWLNHFCNRLMHEYCVVLCQPEQVVAERPKLVQGIAQGATGCRSEPVGVVESVPVRGMARMPVQREAEGGRNVGHDLYLEYLRPHNLQQLLDDKAVHTINVHD